MICKSDSEYMKRNRSSIQSLQFPQLFEILVGKVEDEESDDNAENRREEMLVVEEYKINLVEHIPNASPDEHNSKND